MHVKQPATGHDLDALEQALLRFGYTRPIYHFGFSFAWGDGQHTHYYRDAGSLERLPADCKPYRLIIDNGAIAVFHGDCGDCLCAENVHQHEIEFLQAMVPVLGKLDAHAELEPGEEYRLGPRLRVHL